jgi:hypothetical protein
MRVPIKAAVVSAALFLGACQTAQGPVGPTVGPGPAVTVSGVASTAQQIMDGAVRLCGFQPLFEVAASFVGAGPVGTIVAGICQAIARPRAVGVMAASSGPPVYRGVALRGTYVR